MAPPKRGKRSPQASKSSVGEKSVQSKDTDIHSEMKWEEEHGVKGNSPHISPESNDAIALDDLELVDEEIAGDGDGKVHRSNTGPAYAMGGGYNALKSFQDQVYSGMAIGGSHTWNYDPGVWKETKEEPDLWKIDYHTTKRRARNAPKGSGAPVGTEYHWLIVAHQNVKKVDANTYETHLKGSKYKLAHKAATSNSWSVPTVKGQRDREMWLLDDAKRRVQGLPPVSSGEKVKIEKHEKGQQKLDSLLAKDGDKKTSRADERKRKRHG